MTKLKNLIVIKLKNSNCDKTSVMKNVNVWRRENLKGSFIKNILTPWQSMRCSLGSVLRFLRCFLSNRYSSLQEEGLMLHRIFTLYLIVKAKKINKLSTKKFIFEDKNRYVYLVLSDTWRGGGGKHQTVWYNFGVSMVFKGN